MKPDYTDLEFWESVEMLVRILIGPALIAGAVLGLLYLALR